MWGHGPLVGSIHRSPWYQEAQGHHASPLARCYLGIRLLKTHIAIAQSIHALMVPLRHILLTLAALAVVLSMWMDAVRSRCYVPQVDDHRVSLLCCYQRPKVAQPPWLCHFCPVGGVAVLLVYSFFVDGTNSLWASLQEDRRFSGEKRERQRQNKKERDKMKEIQIYVPKK